VKDSDLTLQSLDHKTVEQFRQHLHHCNCRKPNGGKGRLARNGADAFYKYLRGVGVVRSVDDETTAALPLLVQSFRHWLKRHCGVSESTLECYCRGATQLVETLGDEPGQYKAGTLRAFVLERSRHSGRGTTQALIKALRSFLRYLVAERKCSAALAKAIPSVAVWRLSSLPRYLSELELERTIDACDVDTVAGIRDRAVLLLLARLGLRASDVAGLRLRDFVWQDAILLVSGKSRREDHLPLPQEVGDAVLQYLEVRPRLDTEPVVFLRIQAPWQPLNRGAISQLARRAMRRAGVSRPCGAHVLRHTAATQLLRQGVPLDHIRTLLRHRSVDMTATYAKVDLELLQQVTEPWPEVLRCL
jgi:site-specific recombinase XerD